MNKSTDWNILLQGYLSLMWCQEATKQENQDRKVSDLLSEFKENNEGVEPLNIGSMLSAAYICFMYPQQSEFDRLDFSQIDTTCFKIIEGNGFDAKYICRRIRNSLAHARFEISDGLFKFQDQKLDKSDRFNAEIRILDFGNFLNQFFHLSKLQSLNLAES